MKCNLCNRQAFRTLFNVPFCKRDYIICKNFLCLKTSKDYEQDCIEAIITYLDKKKMICTHDIMDAFGLSFYESKKHLESLAEIGYVANLKEGKWMVLE